MSYLCLVLAVFQRSRIEISLADLVRAFAPMANAIDGLGFDATITEHKRAVVDVLDWLADHDALRLSDGSAENWAHDSERGDALYDIDHDVCASLFRPARPIQQLGSAAGLLDVPDISTRRSAQQEAIARRARRLLVEHPVLYYATLDAETAAALRGTELADNLARLTGLYEHFGPTSFTVQWQYDRRGLLDATIRLLDDLRLLRRMPGGVAVLPAAARYRNITAALPAGARHDGQGMFDFSGQTTEGAV